MARQRAKRAVRQSARGATAAAPVAAPTLTRRIVDGRPQQLAADVPPAESLAFTRADPSHMALTVMATPDPEGIAELASAWQLHPLLVEDLLHAGQRPKLERYGDVLFLVLRSARYIDESEEVEFSEFHLLVRPRTLVIVCQDGRLIDGTEVAAGIDASAAARCCSGTSSCCASAPRGWSISCSTRSSTATFPCSTACRPTRSRSSGRCSAATRRPPSASTTSARR
jgi:magnesium transporter